MKLIMAVINDSDVADVSAAMMAGGFYITKIGSSGGFLRRKLTTVMSAVHEDRKDAALAILRETTHKRKYGINAPIVDKSAPTLSIGGEIVVGGATVFVLDIGEYHKF
ncbi:MAG: cyclic-di-AMP receptor [Clostridiales bacterium]|jgi:uncharacterized protein YaaQ|nr:cyclic-di-AMP receptor [Clostridiales bacterium]